MFSYLFGGPSQSAYDALERQNNRLQSEIRTLENKLRTLEDNLSEVRNKRDEIRARWEDKAEIEEKLRFRIIELENKVKVILEQERKCKVDYQELRKEKTSIEREIDLILKEKDSIQRSLIESNELVDKLRTDILETSKENKVIEEERNLLEKRKTELQYLVDELTKLVQNLQNGEEQLLQKVDDLEKNSVVCLEMEAEIRTLNSKLNTLEGILSQVRKDKDEIRARLEDKIKIENDLRLRLIELENKVMVISENSRKIKVEYDDLLEVKTSIEGKMDLILREKDSIEKSLIESNELVDKLSTDILEAFKKNKLIEVERNLLEKTTNELEYSVDELTELVQKLQNGEEQLFQKVVDLENKCVVCSEKMEKMITEIDILLKEKQEIEGTFGKVTKEKSLVTKDLNEALKILEEHKLTIDQLVSEIIKINDAKNQGETIILKLEKQLDNLKNTISTLEKSIILQIDTIKQLEYEDSRQKATFDQAIKERNSAQLNLDGEKLKVQNLSERISKMDKDIEKHIAEKKELESARALSEDDILEIKKSLEKSQKESDDSKANLRVSQDNMGRILKLLHTTSMICNSINDDIIRIDQENEFGEEIKDYVKEVDAIKKAFKEKESIEDELKNQIELLQVSTVAKANNRKSFWTMMTFVL